MVSPVSSLRSADRLETMIAFKEEKFKETRPKLQELLRKEFLDVLRLQGRPETAKRLKNTRVERLLWEVLRPSNVQEIEGIIASISRA
jgi:hypothetical protein